LLHFAAPAWPNDGFDEPTTPGLIPHAGASVDP
jgi:hypothetical protein